MLKIYNIFSASYLKKMYRNITLLWVTLIYALTTLTCGLGPEDIYGSFIADHHEVQMFYAKNWSSFNVENLRGNISVKNTDSDSIKISVDRFASSTLDQNQAELYLIVIFALMDTVIQDSAFYKTFWPTLTLDQTARVDLTIEIPSYINLTTNILSEGNQVIDVAVPINSTGNLILINNAGNIDLNLYQSSSFLFAADVINGLVEFENLNPGDFSGGSTGPGITIQRVFNEGTGIVIAAIATGTLKLIGKN